MQHVWWVGSFIFYDLIRNRRDNTLTLYLYWDQAFSWSGTVAIKAKKRWLELINSMSKDIQVCNEDVMMSYYVVITILIIICQMAAILDFPQTSGKCQNWTKSNQNH